MSNNARLFTDEEELMIGYIYRDGMSMSRIAEKYPCTAATVMHIVKRVGLETRSKIKFPMRIVNKRSNYIKVGLPHLK